MTHTHDLTWRLTAALSLLTAVSAHAGSPVQIGPSGQTYASAAVLCMANPDTGAIEPAVQTGLRQPTARTRALVRLDGTRAARLSLAQPAVQLVLAAGMHNVSVTLGQRLTDRYTFTVADQQCVLPDTSGNSIDPSGTLETAASGHSSATVSPGCGLNPATGEVQPFVNLFALGNVLLNVSINGVPLTQLGPQHPSTPVFLQAGFNVLTAAAGAGAVDAYVRDTGDGSCSLTP